MADGLGGDVHRSQVRMKREAFKDVGQLMRSQL